METAPFPVRTIAVFKFCLCLLWILSIEMSSIFAVFGDFSGLVCVFDVQVAMMLLTVQT